MVHIRDFLDYIAARAEAGKPRRREDRRPKPPSLGEVDLSVDARRRPRSCGPVLFVPPSMPAVDLLVRMQATRTHMALVIDEYGGTDGLVSIEDLVEMVVGDIEDEHDVDGGAHDPARGRHLRRRRARASLEEVSEALGVDLAIGELAEEVDTLGGLIVTLAGRVPSRGELIAGPDQLEFEIARRRSAPRQAAAHPSPRATPADAARGAGRAGLGSPRAAGRAGRWRGAGPTPALTPPRTEGAATSASRFRRAEVARASRGAGPMPDPPQDASARSA